MAFTMCDGSDYVTESFLFHDSLSCWRWKKMPLVSWVRCGTWLYRFLIFAPLLTLYMSFNAIMHKKKQIHGSGIDFKESFKLFETI